MYVNVQKGKVGRAELDCEHLHFSFYKENKDTIQVICYVSMRLDIICSHELSQL